MKKSTQIKNILKYKVYLIATIILMSSCKEENQNPIPNLPVNIYINLTLPAYQSLNHPGGWAYVTGGSKGLIVYRNFDTFIALDRHTTYTPDSICSIAEVDSINFFVINDPCSSSQYNLTDGTVVKGPAKWGLRNYYTSWDGNYNLQITN